MDIGSRNTSEILNDKTHIEEKNPMYFVNPEIIEKSEDNSTYEEGCLSVPGQFAEVDRPNKMSYKVFRLRWSAKRN